MQGVFYRETVIVNSREGARLKLSLAFHFFQTVERST
ncbi:Uncharacterised protein [Vibrio cholerae]|nr:Uncharacterised protein [Vibrio cholerae]